MASRKGAKKWIHVKHVHFPIAQKITKYARSAGKKQNMKINEQITLEMIDQDYKQFVEKFKPKKTTDDCYTPENVYTAVVQWARDQYGIDPANIVRPFWPGGDYEAMNYPEGCVVLDNPPFSIITKIVRSYTAAGVKFFLFAPYLTNFSCDAPGTCHIVTDIKITYENGARVNTSFVTNLDPEYKLRTAPLLRQMIAEAEYQNTHKEDKRLPKYEYPSNLITATMLGRLSVKGVDYRIPAGEAVWIDALEQQRKQGKKLFGAGYLISDRAAAEKEKAEKLTGKKEKETGDIITWELSEREAKAVKILSEKAEGRKN